MVVVFIRHGIAEKSRNPETDAARELTPEGRRKMARIAKGLERMVPDLEDAYLWTSPLVRARQTAEVLADRLETLQKCKEQPFLAEPEWEGPASALRSLPANATVLMVGHEPYLGDWCKELCGARLLFRRGGAAAVEFSDGPDKPGTLLWFAQPRMLQMMRRDSKE